MINIKKIIDEEQTMQVTDYKFKKTTKTEKKINSAFQVHIKSVRKKRPSELFLRFLSNTIYRSAKSRKKDNSYFYSLDGKLNSSKIQVDFQNYLTRYIRLKRQQLRYKRVTPIIMNSPLTKFKKQKVKYTSNLLTNQFLMTPTFLFKYSDQKNKLRKQELAAQKIARKIFQYKKYLKTLKKKNKKNKNNSKNVEPVKKKKVRRLKSVSNYYGPNKIRENFVKKTIKALVYYKSLKNKFCYSLINLKAKDQQVIKYLQLPIFDRYRQYQQFFKFKFKTPYQKGQHQKGKYQKKQLKKYKEVNAQRISDSKKKKNGSRYRKKLQKLRLSLFRKAIGNKRTKVMRQLAKNFIISLKVIIKKQKAIQIKLQTKLKNVITRVVRVSLEKESRQFEEEIKEQVEGVNEIKKLSIIQKTISIAAKRQEKQLKTKMRLAIQKSAVIFPKYSLKDNAAYYIVDRYMGKWLKKEKIKKQAKRDFFERKGYFIKGYFSKGYYVPGQLKKGLYVKGHYVKGHYVRGYYTKDREKAIAKFVKKKEKALLRKKARKRKGYIVRLWKSNIRKAKIAKKNREIVCLIYKKRRLKVTRKRALREYKRILNVFSKVNSRGRFFQRRCTLKKRLRFKKLVKKVIRTIIESRQKKAISQILNLITTTKSPQAVRSLSIPKTEIFKLKQSLLVKRVTRTGTKLFRNIKKRVVQLLGVKLKVSRARQQKANGSQKKRRNSKNQNRIQVTSNSLNSYLTDSLTTINWLRFLKAKQTVVYNQLRRVTNITKQRKLKQLSRVIKGSTLKVSSLLIKDASLSRKHRQNFKQRLKEFKQETITGVLHRQRKSLLVIMVLRAKKRNEFRFVTKIRNTKLKAVVAEAQQALSIRSTSEDLVKKVTEINELLDVGVSEEVFLQNFVNKEKKKELSDDFQPELFDYYTGKNYLMDNGTLVPVSLTTKVNQTQVPKVETVKKKKGLNYLGSLGKNLNNKWRNYLVTKEKVRTTFLRTGGRIKGLKLPFASQRTEQSTEKGTKHSIYKEKVPYRGKSQYKGKLQDKGNFQFRGKPQFIKKKKKKRRLRGSLSRRLKLRKLGKVPYFIRPRIIEQKGLKEYMKQCNNRRLLQPKLSQNSRVIKKKNIGKVKAQRLLEGLVSKYFQKKTPANLNLWIHPKNLRELQKRNVKRYYPRTVMNFLKDYIKIFYETAVTVSEVRTRRQEHVILQDYLLNMGSTLKVKVLESLEKSEKQVVSGKRKKKRLLQGLLSWKPRKSGSIWKIKKRRRVVLEQIRAIYSKGVRYRYKYKNLKINIRRSKRVSRRILKAHRKAKREGTKIKKHLIISSYYYYLKKLRYDRIVLDKLNYEKRDLNVTIEGKRKLSKFLLFLIMRLYIKKTIYKRTNMRLGIRRVKQLRKKKKIAKKIKMLGRRLRNFTVGVASNSKKYIGTVKKTILIKVLIKILRSLLQAGTAAKHGRRKIKEIIKIFLYPVLINKRQIQKVRLRKKNKIYLVMAHLFLYNIKQLVKSANYSINFFGIIGSSITADYVLRRLRERLVACKGSGFWFITKIMRKLMNSKHVVGFKLKYSGRLTGNSMAQQQIMKRGIIGNSNMNVYIDYAQDNIVRKHGKCGLKLWIIRNLLTYMPYKYVYTYNFKK
ncbi:hypothetical protein RB653_011170 (mitochondrion) [Dictyostelium firmibasis]|uniref:Small ribosomal subunit protein uS3 C-terminal domain-containing protein n=1 Tax=Dictyostelium firmibasis TaxID=79012 RepID=A0AAN7TQR5_9MYCE